MVKRGMQLLVLGTLILLIAPLISAGIVEWFNELTGKATSSPVDLSITVTGGTAPSILVHNVSITDVSSQLNEGPAYTGVVVKFTATDAQGYANLDDTTAYINYTKATEDTRINSTCSRITGESTGTTANYTCNVSMWWWDVGGTWNIKAYIKDLNGNAAMNNSTTFQVGTLAGFYAGPSSLSWTSIAPGAVNQLSNNDPVVLNNSGNLVRNIQMNATNLRGDTTPSYGLWAGNFSVDETDACDVGPAMVAATFTAITGSSLTTGNYTANGVNGREELYACLELSGAELIAQAYSTTTEGSWTVKIVA